jgi:hypothetical protein
VKAKKGEVCAKFGKNKGILIKFTFLLRCHRAITGNMVENIAILTLINYVDLVLTRVMGLDGPFFREA